MLEESSGESTRMLEESSGESTRMLVDNCPESHKPVEISDSDFLTIRERGGA